MYHSPDVHTFLFLLELFHFNLHRVRDLLFVMQKYLFPNDLGNEKFFGFIGQHIFIVKRGRLGKEFDYPFHQVVDVEIMQCRYGEYFTLRQLFLPVKDDLVKPFLIDKVDLVHNYQYGNVALFYPLQKFIIFVGFLERVGNVQQYVGIFQGRMRKLQH